MGKQYILAIDQGTSSSRAILFDRKLQIVGIEQTEFTQLYPKPGWVEHNPDEIWESQYGVCIKLLQKLNISVIEIAALGITNQRETTIVWDRHSGKPVYNAIVWQDKRTSDFCNQLNDSGLSDLIKQKTGLVIDPYFSATKIHWILNNVEGLKEKALKLSFILKTKNLFLAYHIFVYKI